MTGGTRAQSNVVGVALLLGITVVGIGGLTAGIGTVVENNAASADATAVADGFDEAFRPTETTGKRVGHVRFTEGTLRTQERTLRILNESGTVETVQVDALAFESGERRVTYHAGAIVRGTPGGAWLHRPPSVTASRDDDGVLVISVPALDTSHQVLSGSSGHPVRLETDTMHDRTRLGTGSYAIAVETEVPGPWIRYFEDVGATVESTHREFDGDETTSVVARFDGDRTSYLVVHDVHLEVGHG